MGINKKETKKIVSLLIVGLGVFIALNPIQLWLANNLTPLAQIITGGIILGIGAILLDL